MSGEVRQSETEEERHPAMGAEIAEKGQEERKAAEKEQGDARGPPGRMEVANDQRTPI